MANRILVDAFGGDSAPECTVLGALQAAEELGVAVTLVGEEERLRRFAAERGLSLDSVMLQNADGVMDMHAPPTDIVKSARGTSMGVGLTLLAEGKGDAFVSAGSTGALVVGATLIVGRIAGIRRPALATLVPTPAGRPYLLVDCGANAECRPDMLLDFALMGQAYMRDVAGVENPAVGLLNVGTEDAKGDSLRQETYRLLAAAPLRFAGNVEAREVPAGACDVVVTDGFAGNVVLKLTEGVAASFFSLLRQTMTDGMTAKLGAGLLKGRMRELKNQMDYTEHGGAPLLGVKQPVIKAHGSSNAKAIFHAIRQADRFASARLPAVIAAAAKAAKPGREKASE